MSDLQHLAPSFIVIHGYDDLSAVPMRKISPCQTLVESFYHLQEPPLNVMLKIPHGFKNKMQPTNRMLTHMLMVQTSKHMDMQSRRTLFCNSLFEQSCAYFPCYQSAVWSVECSVWSVKCRVWSLKCGV